MRLEGAHLQVALDDQHAHGAVVRAAVPISGTADERLSHASASVVHGFERRTEASANGTRSHRQRIPGLERTVRTNVPGKGHGAMRGTKTPARTAGRAGEKEDAASTPRSVGGSTSAELAQRLHSPRRLSPWRRPARPSTGGFSRRRRASKGDHHAASSVSRAKPANLVFSRNRSDFTAELLFSRAIGTRAELVPSMRVGFGNARTRTTVSRVERAIQVPPTP